MSSLNPHPLFLREKEDLLSALGALTAGGVLEHIQEVGAAAILDDPSLPLDIALAAWPFPLEPPACHALYQLGFVDLPGFAGGSEIRFRHAVRPIQLFICAAGTSTWANHLLLRDYLRAVPKAHAHYAARRFQWSQSRELFQVKADFFAALLPAAQAWWIDTTGFTPLQVIATELDGCGLPWYFSSGWALDLFLGRVTRLHHDVDVILDYADQLKLRAHLSGRGWQFISPYEKRFSPLPEFMRLEPPRHQFHAHRGEEFIDFLLSPIHGEVWHYRRQPEIVRHIRHMALTSPQGWLYLAPELVLLYKSVNTSGQERSKDQLDVKNVLPALDDEQRAWLRWALLATTPSHPWLAQL